MESPGFSENRCGVNTPSCTRFKHSSKRLPSGSGNDGIRARDLLAVERFFERNKLAWLEMKLLHLGHFEDEVADFGRDVVKFENRGSHAVIQHSFTRRDRATLRPARDGHPMAL